MVKTPSKLIIVPKSFSGERLQSVLKYHLGDAYSGKRVKQIIDGYGCRVNGKVELFSSYKVRCGDQIQVDLKEIVSSKVVPPKILYEDEDFLIWDKPAHTVSDQKTVGRIFSSKTLYLVHRLDKDTTGVMLLAKNSAIQKRLEELFKAREIEKTYEAIAQGESKSTLFTVENTLGKICQYDGQVVWGMVPNGVHALTYFEVLKRSRGYLRVKCVPVTGRTHQIRVHLAERNLPILGDYHYARDKVFTYKAPRVFLHATSITLMHPITKKPLSISAPCPEDMYKALGELCLHV